jgi:hypothetical protein
MRFNYRIFKNVTEFRPLSDSIRQTRLPKPTVVFWDKFRTQSNFFLIPFQVFDERDEETEAMHAI